MQLSDICSIRSGFSARTRLDPDPAGVLALQQGCVTLDGTLDLSGALRISHEHFSRQHVVVPGDVLLRSRGDAVSAWAVDDTLQEPAIALLPLYILRPTTDRLDAGYLAWLIAQPAAQSHFARESVGSNIQMIKKPAIESLPLQLPPLVVQEQIATTVRFAARERSLLTRLAELKHTLLTYKLNELNTTHLDRNNA